ncbi:Hsp70 family protein [Thalassospira xiamenensis]|uniref:Hsp70 family protein n=1 Tax=Thalassospira xiamenensis TaxID=220697 RepID=UPI000DEDB7A7|nr:molecular chaperone HscC [Thalassospira xiamenensis]RCK42787.1 hypothetical protein TH24_01050 [Thalassospira xiamenensis]
MSQPPIGIDLGTTNSLVSAFVDGKPQLIPNALGEFLTPSVVSISDGELIVGKGARERLFTHRDKTISLFKRKMGTQSQIKLGAEAYSPAELSSFVLSKLRQDAELYLGCEIRDVVVSVPAYFNQQQRRATQEACKLAGLNLLRLVNEPTAAALAYGVHEKDAETQFLVVDLGGGTFDVTILEMFDGVMEVKASSGDAFLGGEDFTEVLAKQICEKIERPWHKLGGQFQAELRAHAEIAKVKISNEESCTVKVFDKQEIYEVKLTRDEFAEGAKPLLQRMLIPIERCMYDVSLKSEDLDRILLVGGATRMPMLRHMVAKHFGKFPEFNIDPDHAVALGASVQAALLAEDRALDDVVMTDVSPFSVGIEIGREVADGRRVSGLFSPIIERNTPLPASRVGSFQTLDAKQQEVLISVYQGESAYVADNIKLGQYTVKLPRKRKDKEYFEVLLVYDTSGLLEVEATLGSSGEKHGLIIETLSEDLSPEKLAERLEKMRTLKSPPRENEVNQSLVARLDRVYAMTRGSDRQRVLDMIASFESVLDQRDPVEIDRIRGEIEQMLNRIDDFYVS